MANDLQVVIAGGGVAGVSTAYHLVNSGVKNIMILESGKVGRGSDEILSGTAGPPVPQHTKMVTTWLNGTRARFSSIHSEEGSKIYLELVSTGREILISIAQKLDSSLVRRLGSLIVGHGIQFKWIKEEHMAYQKLGFRKDCKYFSRNEIHELYGNTKTAFDGGLFVPAEAIVAQNRYLETMIREANIHVETAKVMKIEEHPDYVTIKTEKRGEISADQVVVATNGFFYEDEKLRDLLKPVWDFIICYKDPGPNTPNTWNFKNNFYYWTRQYDEELKESVLMIGGESRPVKNGNTRYSVDEKKALGILERWTNKVFPRTKDKRPVAIHFGIFARTPDRVPIVGKFSEGSRVSYIVGCNGDAHSAFTYSASLMPGLLGYTGLTPQQVKIAKFISPGRITLRKDPHERGARSQL